MPVFPTPRVYGAGPSLRWGVLAPGRIAAAFVGAVQERTAGIGTGQRIVAVASRSPERAAGFAARFGIERAHAGYEQLVADPQVDVVYIAAPASEHRTLGLLAIAAGKHVLIEKPLGMDATEARELVAAARAAGVLLMEAMWSRYFPQASVIRDLIADGALGEVRGVHADFGHVAPTDPGHRMQHPELGGGAVLDLGVYPIQLASMAAGPAVAVTAVGSLAPSGVDAFNTTVLRHASGAQSTLTTSMITRSASRAAILGGTARIELEGPFHVPGGLTLIGAEMGAVPQRWDDRTGVTMFGGLAWEAEAAAEFIGEGRLESPVHTHDETVAILETADQILRQLRAAAGQHQPAFSTTPGGTR